jgi:uncharacterized hydrophobic protein (TIGR00271 family)
MTKIQEIPTRIVRTINRLIHPLSADERKQVIAEIAPTASPGFDFFLLVVLSCSIATLGLVTNSPAVIIGAMLLAPLMSPIIGIGLASITGDDKLIKTSASALLRGAGLAILLSYLMTLVNRFLPFVALQELPDEVLARIRPTPIDLVIALAGGLAAAYAMTRPNLSAALPGVAIATALMPPLCTIGIGIALNRWNVAGGASLLFITNAVTIAFASALVFFLRGFSAEARRAGQRLPRSLILSAILVAILLVPLSYYSVKFFRDAADNRLINTVVSQEVARLGDVQLVDVQVIHQDGTLDMVITLRTNIALDYEKVVVLQEAIVAGINRPVSLRVEQVIAEELNPLIPPTPIPTPTATFTQTLGPSPPRPLSPPHHPRLQPPSRLGLRSQDYRLLNSTSLPVGQRSDSFVLDNG